MIKEVELLEKFRDMKVQVQLGSEFIRCSTLTISNDLLNSVRERQLLDASLNRVREQPGSDEAKDFALGHSKPIDPKFSFLGDELEDVYGQVGSVVH